MAESCRKHKTHDEVSGRVNDNLCQPCLTKDKQTKADTFCLTCNEFQCTSCSNVHDVLPILRSHKLIDAKNVKENQETFDMKGLDQCDQHREVLKFYCEDENQLCCSSCAVFDHRKCHSVVEVQMIAGKMSPGSELKEKLQEVKENAEQVNMNLNSLKQQMEQDAKEIPEKIRKKRDEVIEMFNATEASVDQKVETFKNESLAELNTRQSQNESNLACANEMLELFDSVHRIGTVEQQFIVNKKMEKHVQSVYNKVSEEFQSVKTVVISFNFAETLKLPPLPMSDYIPGQLTLKYEVAGTARPVKSGMKITPVNSIDLKKSRGDEEEPFYSGIDFLSDGRLIAVDNLNKKCLVYNENLEKVGSYKLPYRPQSVAALSKDCVAITGGGKYRIDILKVSESNEITLDKSFKVKTKYEAICTKDNNTYIAGTIDDPKPVRMISLSGEEKDVEITFSNEKYPIGVVACTYIRNGNKIVISDRIAVHIYDVTTNMKFEVKDTHLQQPRGVAVGPNDTILACSKGTNSIARMSQTGQILASYKIDMKYPNSLCTSRCQSFLAVTNLHKGNKKLQKFKMSTT